MLVPVREGRRLGSTRLAAPCICWSPTPGWRGHLRDEPDHDLDRLIAQVLEVARLPVVAVRAGSPRRGRSGAWCRASAGRCPQAASRTPQGTKYPFSLLESAAVAHETPTTPLPSGVTPSESSGGELVGALRWRTRGRSGGPRWALEKRVGEPTCQHRPDRMEPVLEGGHHAEVASPPAHAPEEVLVLLLAGRQEPTVGGTTSAEMRLSQARPYLPLSQPRPPPRVSPAIPVTETTPRWWPAQTPGSRGRNRPR